MVGAGRVVGEGDGVNTLGLLPNFAPAFWTDAGAFHFESLVCAALTTVRNAQPRMED